MSTDTPTPERVTLTDDERGWLRHKVGMVPIHGVDPVIAWVENLLAARDAALRTQIKTNLLVFAAGLECRPVDPASQTQHLHREVCSACEPADRLRALATQIAGGDQ